MARFARMVLAVIRNAALIVCACAATAYGQAPTTPALRATPPQAGGEVVRHVTHEYTDQDVGVTTLRAYTYFPELFAGARWIWSFNLVFDNLVLARKTMR